MYKRQVLLHKVDEERTHEKAVRVAAYETDLKENCDNIARNLIGQAVSRCAADHCSETTVSVVPLPSDEMKGRIIGREGRNIRALETATGVDLIIDVYKRQDEKTTLKTWTIMETLVGGVGFLVALIISFFA